MRFKNNANYWLKLKSVKPFADEVNCNTCRDSHYKTGQHCPHLLPEGKKALVACVFYKKYFSVTSDKKFDKNNSEKYNPT